MKYFFTLLFIMSSAPGWSQEASKVSTKTPWHSFYAHRSLTATMSLGFIDGYRQNYIVPRGYEKDNTSGFVPFYAKLEYGIGKHISLGATFAYDAFVYNLKQDFMGNNGPFARYKPNKTRIFSGGLTAFYHLDRHIHIRNLDPFIGLGLSLNNIRYSAYPQADSTTKIRIDHTVTPYVKAGARYYITNQVSLFGDVGYDKQSIFSLGFSCRFLRRHSSAD
jgi:hypothetical protein